MKVFCPICFGYEKLVITPFVVLGDEVCGNIVCPECGTTIAELMCDDDEWEVDDMPEGYYDLKKIPDYYPNGG